MYSLSRIALSVLVILQAVLTPSVAYAGGGGGGSKSRISVRIKNVGAASANTPRIVLETVKVGDSGNDPAIIGSESFGYVGSTFRMSKYEVTVTEYAAFLNAVATRGDQENAAVVESLYDSRMGSDKNTGGITRSGSGTAATPYKYTVTSNPLAPVTYVDFFSAARFANWMHNGATATADIESGAYSLGGGSIGSIPRSAGAKWWIPSENEWFKAAYYKGGSTSAGYWMFPTQADTLPRNSPSDGTNVANFLRSGVFSVTQSTNLDANQNYLTPVGTFINAPSPYGTFDQGGNVEEWTDDVVYTEYGVSRRTRGGAWNSGGLNDDVSPIPTALPSDRSSKIGFRLARAADEGGETPATASRTFMVNLGGAAATQTGGRSLAPNQITQYTINRGSFVVSAQDAELPSLTASETFHSGNRKTIFIQVKLVSNEIVIEESSSSF